MLFSWTGLLLDLVELNFRLNEIDDFPCKISKSVYFDESLNRLFFMYVTKNNFLEARKCTEKPTN